MNLFKSKKGYTLVELLVAIGIIAVLLSISIPTIVGIVQTTRLKTDRDMAKSYQSAISLWMSEQPNDKTVYYQNLSSTSLVGTTHSEIAYTNAYMGTQQLPGIEFENSKDIRNAALSAMKALIKDKIEMHGADSYYLHHPESNGYGYKYYYRVGVVSVENITSSVPIHHGENYEYYIWLDYQPTATENCATTPIPKFEKIEGSTSSDVAKPTFKFEFSLRPNEDVNECVFEIEDRQNSFTLSGNNITPQVFVEGQYKISYYYAGELKFSNFVEITYSDIDTTTSTVKINFTDTSIQLSSDPNKFTVANGVITKYEGDEEVIIIPAQKNGQYILRIGANAFKNCTAKKIVAPYTICYVGKDAFNNCPNLEYVSLPVPILAEHSIVNCPKLNTVDLYIPPNDGWMQYDKLSQTYPKNAISNCPSLKNLNIPHVYTSFHAAAFDELVSEGNGITITINLVPEQANTQLNKYGDAIVYTFSSSKRLTTYNATTGQASLNKNAGMFYREETSLAFAHRLDNKLFTMINALSATEHNALRPIYSSFNSIVIDVGYTTIGAGAFRGFEFKNITLPATITSIGANAFDGNQITTLDLPASVTSVGDYAFRSETLQTIAIRGSLSAFSQKSFDECPRVKTVIIYDYEGNREDITPEQFGLSSDVNIIFA